MALDEQTKQKVGEALAREQEVQELRKEVNRAERAGIEVSEAKQRLEELENMISGMKQQYGNEVQKYIQQNKEK